MSTRDFIEKDYYAALGVPKDADAAEIKRAYRKLARDLHPDTNAGGEDRFKEVSEAYDVLSDPEQRHRYDAFGPQFRQVPEGVDPEAWAATQRAGSTRRAGAGAGRGRASPGGYTWTTTGGDDDEVFAGFGGVDIDDLLEGFLGRTGRGAGARRGPARGTDTEAEVVLSLEEAYSGTRRRITLSGPGGDRSLEVTIPAGVVDGQRIRLAGQGSPGDGGSPGDLYLVARIQPHPRFRLDGRDVIVDLAVTPWEAALGAKVPVGSPGGEHKVTVPPGSSSGRRLRLKRQGLPSPKGAPGDLYAEVKIVVPKRLSTRERELFEELGRASDFDPRRHR